MGKDDFADLVGIWERWTNSHPLLRQIVQEYHGAGASRRQVEHGLMELLVILAGYDQVDDTIIAALCAGWAVLLALDDAVHTTTYMRLRCTALDAHRDALLQAASE
jgi:hypothetical protein